MREVSEIYRRYNPNPGQQMPRSAAPPQQKQNSRPNPSRQPSQPSYQNQPRQQNQGSHPNPPQNQVPQQKQSSQPKPPPKPSGPKPQNITDILQNLIPRGLYNPETKKILGIISAEDLLLVALIFLFLEDGDEDNPLLALALVYVLLSDYIDIGDFSF